MIRVVYRWNVEPESFEQFRAAWSLATNRIHEQVVGARGSFMLQNHEQRHEVITIARWDDLESWKAFWGTEPPPQMAVMHDLGRRLSVDVYDELEDHTY